MGDDIVSFILKSRERGRMDDQITQQLLSVGWRKDRIAEAFARISEQAAYDKRGSSAERPPLQLSPDVLAQSRQPEPAQASQNPAAVSQSPTQTMPAVQTPAASSPSISPANQIELEMPQKKSFFSSLFGKKPTAPSQQPATAPAQAPASAPQQSPSPTAQPSPTSTSAPQQQTPPPISRPIPSPPSFSPAIAATPASQAQQEQKPPISLQPIKQGPDLKKLALYGVIIVLAILIAAAIFNTFISPGALTGQAKTNAPSFVPSIQNRTIANASSIANSTLDANKSKTPSAPNTSQQKNTTPPAQQTTPAAASIPNATSPTLPATASPPAPAPAAPPPAPAPVPVISQPPPVPEVAPANEQAQPANFTRAKKFFSSWPYEPGKFCNLQENGTFYRAHYIMYYGGECTSEKGVDGFDNSTTAQKNCADIPCCFAGPYSEYSTRYDYFECGYYS